MAEIQFIQERPLWKDILFYVLCALFPGVGLMFLMIDKNNNTKTNKKNYLVSLISISVITLSFLVFTILFAVNNNFVFIGLSYRKIGLIYFTYYLINSISYLVFIKIYFNKFETIEYKKEKYYRILKYICVFLTVIFSVLIVYFLDEIVTSFPRGFPFEEFKYSSATPTIAFYAICILIGALVAWFVAREKARDEGYDRSIFETIFYLAFPAGIIGARAWWVISEWNRDLAGRHTLADIFDFRGGGLAIQGGVLLGALVGIWFMLEFHREMKISKAIDLVIPGILLAQAIGRLGNFFNVEVYGALANPDDWWFLPKVIITHFQDATGGKFYIPLFLIEGLLNVVGYFIITYAIGKGLKKFLVTGDLAFSYLIWYGTVRISLEPLRDSAYKMPTSMYMSAAFIIAGVLCIIINHIINYLKNKEFSIRLKETTYSNFKKCAIKIESLPKWAKLLLSLPVINGFVFGFYRFIKGHYLTGILHIFVGGLLTWILDIIYIVLDKPLLLSKDYV